MIHSERWAQSSQTSKSGFRACEAENQIKILENSPLWTNIPLLVYVAQWMAFV